jgi:HK97 family phage major capsid protein
MDNLSALREKLSTLANSANHMIGEKGDQVWNKDEQSKYDAIIDDANSTKQAIKNIEEARKLDAEKFFDDVTNQAKKPNTETIGAMDAMALYLRNGTNVTPEQAVAIRNAMSTTTPSEGGFTVPAQVASMVIDAMKAYGGMREAAQVITTDNGQNWTYPASDGTSEVGAIVGQNAQAPLGELTFSNVALNVFYYTSNRIALPYELVQDSAIDVVEFVVNRLGQRLGRIQNTHFTIGTGTSQPDGVIPRATLGKTGATGQTLTIIYDDLVDTLRSVNRAYRDNAKWMMNDLTIGVVSKVKDTTGRPIWSYGYTDAVADGRPDLLMGYEVVTNDDVPVMAANARSIAFGDFSKYIIRDVANTAVIKRFDDSAFALSNQVGFCGWQRSGGNLVDPQAVKVYRNSAT